MVNITLRASEIAQFVYCHRAWWYAKQGCAPTNSGRRRIGTRWHHRHGRNVLAARNLRLLGYAFLLVAVAVALAHLVGFSLG